VKRPGEAALCFFAMAFFLLLAVLSFTDGNAKQAGVMVVLAALFMAAGATLARGK
jgi:uncharacterized protein involved in response to NO